MIRGDDDLFSVMDEMSTSGERKDKGGVTSNEHNKHIDARAPKHTNISSHQQQRIRMVSEIAGYKDRGTGTEAVKACPENGLKGNIWNPYIFIDLDTKDDPSNSSPSSTLYTPPTSPYVEVARRRAYEKFKKNFYQIFHWISTQVQTHNRQGQSQKSGDEGDQKDGFDFNILWSKSSHNILERYYFASKVEESFQIIASRKNHKDPSKIRVPQNGSISQIVTLVNAGREGGLLMDPILLAPFQRVRNSNHLLRNEVQFQLTREYKRAAKSKNTDVKVIQEYFESHAFKRKISKTARSINDIAIEAEVDFLADLQKKALQAVSMSTKGKRKGIPKLSFESKKDVESGDLAEFFWLKFSGLNFKISKAHFEKLQVLFDRHNPSSPNIQTHMDLFYSSLFTLLTRYDLLEGGGLQSAISGDVFDVLLHHFDCKMECFASPFNCRYERFFSAFEDTDAPFGSLGSFFNFDFEKLTHGGCFQANPPFASDFILQMCTRMEKVLSDDSLPPFMFVVFVPAWQESQGWQALSKSGSLAHHLFLSQKDNTHYYCEGTQHRRMKKRYRIASFDTSVFFLQNSAGREKWKITEEMLHQLTSAFGTNPEEVSTNNDLKEKVKPIEKSNIEAKTKGKPQKGSMDEKKVTNVHNGAKNDDTNKRKRKQKHQSNKSNKKVKSKKTFVSDDGKSQLAILSSLGIAAPTNESNQSATITKSKGKKKRRR